MGDAEISDEVWTAVCCVCITDGGGVCWEVGCCNNGDGVGEFEGSEDEVGFCDSGNTGDSADIFRSLIKEVKINTKTGIHKIRSANSPKSSETTIILQVSFNNSQRCMDANNAKEI